MNDIYLDNDYEPEYRVRQKNASTGVVEAATGLTGLTIAIRATPDGATVGSLSVAATERGSTGRYYGIFDGDTLRSELAASYRNRKVYIVFGDGVNVLTKDVVVVRPHRPSTPESS